MELKNRWYMAASPAAHLVTRVDPGVIYLTQPGINKLAVTFRPIQSGSGTPSPTNVRPVSGRNSVAANIGTDVFSKSLDGTYYGGTVDLVSGVLSVEWASVKVSDLSWSYEAANTRFSAKIDLLKKYPTMRTTPIYTEVFQKITDGRGVADVPDYAIYSGANSLFCYIKITDISSISVFTSTYGNVDLVYPLETPQTVQLDSQTINALTGRQTVSSDAGSIEITYFGY